MARAIDADKAIEVAQIKYNDWNLAMAAADGQREINLCFKKQELFKAVKAVLECVPTLTPQNGCVSRLRELDELYTKLHAVTGFTVEQLLEMFAAGYTLEKHDYSKSFEEMASLLEYEKEHANAYYEECGQWEAENTQLKEKLEAIKQDRDAIEQDFRAFAKQWWEEDSGFPCRWCKSENSGNCEWKAKHPGEICAGRAFEWRGQRED